MRRNVLLRDGCTEETLHYMRYIFTFLVKDVIFELEGVGGKGSYTCAVLRHRCLVPEVGNAVCMQCACSVHTVCSRVKRASFLLSEPIFI